VFFLALDLSFKKMLLHNYLLVIPYERLTFTNFENAVFMVIVKDEEGNTMYRYYRDLEKR